MSHDDVAGAGGKGRPAAPEVVRVGQVAEMDDLLLGKLQQTPVFGGDFVGGNQFVAGADDAHAARIVGHGFGGLSGVAHVDDPEGFAARDPVKGGQAPHFGVVEVVVGLAQKVEDGVIVYTEPLAVNEIFEVGRRVGQGQRNGVDRCGDDVVLERVADEGTIVFFGATGKGAHPHRGGTVAAGGRRKAEALGLGLGGEGFEGVAEEG
jgi:hypothetical protein